ncbi:MAG: hypothetical protein GXZ01_04790 [Clostridiaceae bacterium]|nr:hypothetical protein [Clostridiaceae bacterium]
MVFRRVGDLKKNLVRKKNTGAKSPNLWLFWGLLLLLAVLSVFLHLQYVLNLDTIYPNIYIDGIDVGGLHCKEALALLKENIDTSYLSDYFILSVPQKQYRIYFSDIDYKPDYDKAVELAYSIGRTGNAFQRLSEIAKVLRKPLSITPKMCYNIGKMERILESISRETFKEPQNARIEIFNGKVEIQPHAAGFFADIDKNLMRIDNFLVNMVWDKVELYYEEILPDITTQMVERITYKLGEFETSFNPANEPRVHNIKTACSKINQKLLLAGEEFSMDMALGDRTERNGYKTAKVIVNNELVDGLGGGICQVASTIYNTVLLSGLEVLERRNHTLPLSYIEMGRDATISQGYIDFRFRNNTGYAILIEAKTAANRVIVTIWGCEPEIKTFIRIRTRIVEKIEPEGIEKITDPSLKPGETVVIREAKPGYKVEVYRDVMDMSGKLIKTDLISVDTYYPQKKKIRTGLGENEKR